MYLQKTIYGLGAIFLFVAFACFCDDFFEDADWHLNARLMIFRKSGITPILSTDCPFFDFVPYDELLKTSRISQGLILVLYFASFILCMAMAAPAIIADALEVPPKLSEYVSVHPLEDWG